MLHELGIFLCGFMARYTLRKHSAILNGIYQKYAKKDPLEEGYSMIV